MEASGIVAVPLTRVASVVVISDRVDWQDHGASATETAVPPVEHPWQRTKAPLPEVTGGYLERFPLACIAAGLAESAEIWHHQHGGTTAGFTPAGPRLGYRAFTLTDVAAPFDNRAMLAFVQAFGAPHILIVYGLGVSADLLAACAASIIIYNSIDAPALRVPVQVSACFDLVLTGAPWQSDEVRARHPGKLTAVMPVGPEFAAVDLFRPLGLRKDYDLIYVAAAQPYKRHDILLDAFEVLPRDVRGLLLFGYGEDADHIRRRIHDRDLSMECVGPPGVPLEEVNRLMNRARFGVVCGRDDGAPAILTEYMLAGLPVLANAELACGRQYILPGTGMLAAPGDFHQAIMTMRASVDDFSPRHEVLARWTWPHTIERLRPLLRQVAEQKRNSLPGEVELTRLPGHGSSE